MRLRGGFDVRPFSEESISVSGSDSGRYWYENFDMPKEVPPGVLGGPRNISDVLGSLEERINGEKVVDRGIDSAHKHPYTYHEQYQNLPPSPTLYIRNLRESVDPMRMRALLHAVFSKYGRIIYLRAIKTKTMRGQAFVCFKHLDSAVTAQRDLNGFAFLNRTMIISYAKSKSYAQMKLDGSFDEVMSAIRQQFLLNQRAAIKAQAESFTLAAHSTSALALLGKQGGQRAGGGSRSGGGEWGPVGSSAAAQHASLHARLTSAGYYFSTPATALLLIQAGTAAGGGSSAAGGNTPAFLNVTYSDLVSILGQFQGFDSLFLLPRRNLTRDVEEEEERREVRRELRHIAPAVHLGAEESSMQVQETGRAKEEESRDVGGGRGGGGIWHLANQDFRELPPHMSGERAKDRGEESGEAGGGCVEVADEAADDFAAIAHFSSVHLAYVFFFH
jgi:hypothetical protein